MMIEIIGFMVAKILNRMKRLILILNTISVIHPVIIHNCLKSVVSEDKLQK